MVIGLRIVFKSVVESIFTKGNTWVDVNERGIKCIDFLDGDVALKTISDYSICTIALYLYDGELVIAIHGWYDSDTYKEDCMTYYSENIDRSDYPYLKVFGDDTLEELYNIING